VIEFENLLDLLVILDVEVLVGTVLVEKCEVGSFQASLTSTLSFPSTVTILRQLPTTPLSSLSLQEAFLFNIPGIDHCAKKPSLYSIPVTADTIY
jgi:hypothetical protein